MSSGLIDTSLESSGTSYGSGESSYGNPYELLQALCTGQIKPEQAEKISREALGNSPQGPWVVPLGLALYQLEKYQDSIDILQANEQGCAELVDFYIIAGMVARQLPDQKKLANSYYRHALSLDPSRPDIFYNLGNLLKDDEPEEAEKLYRKSLNLNPSQATVWHNLGIALNNQNRFDEAIEPLRNSVRLDPTIADVWCNLGLGYYGIEEFENAERSFRISISLDQSHAASHLNLGNALMNVLQPEEAIRFLERGAELETSSKNSLFNLGLAYLLLGRYREGWEYYEARFEGKELKSTKIPTSGSQIRNFLDLPAPGETPVVIWSEQGMGDSIQFCRYLALLDAAEVPYVFLTRDPLLKLQRDWTGLGQRVQPSKSADPENDQRRHIPLMSLPLVFGTELHTVPSAVPYLTTNQPIPENLQVTPPPGALSVGIAWASNPDNKAMYRNKSMQLELLMPLLIQLADLGLITIHSLQFGEDHKQLSPWLDHQHVTEWKDILMDFSDTAHVIRQLDLIISVDTGVAHLSGALNRPTWLLLPKNADFRWLLDRSDSPWYPSMRIFRQNSHGDWESVVEQVKYALDQMFLLDINNLAQSEALKK